MWHDCDRGSRMNTLCSNSVTFSGRTWSGVAFSSGPLRRTSYRVIGGHACSFYASQGDRVSFFSLCHEDKEPAANKGLRGQALSDHA